MAQVTQPNYVESNKTAVQNSTRLVGQSVFIGGPGDSSLSNVNRFNQDKAYSEGVFIGIDGHRN